ncbi:MAG: type II toxin-antitoxin system death-on-curing family toxin [Nitrospirae bacterium]|nr:type II toxin-antitoxin system death-on-curing family toxin [Nitrospirota bacterium]
MVFLSLAEVVEIHASHIRRYGGREGVRDMNLLSSAVAMPYASSHGRFLHNDIYEMASAYAFHICQNHPFIDGNKRTALASALVFLEMNGISISDPEHRLYDAMISLARGKLSKSGFAQILRNLRE